MILTSRNPCRVLEDGKTVEMELTQGKVCLLDLGDLPKVAGIKWCAFKSRSKTVFYAISTKNGKQVGGVREKNVILWMHRIIMGCGPGEEVDHVNHDGLDNRRENLRRCDRTSNVVHLQGPKSNNKSGFIGVSFHGRSGKFMAYIDAHKKRVHLGYFEDPKIAAAIRDREAVKLHGEFATLNLGGDHEVTISTYEGLM